MKKSPSTLWHKYGFGLSCWTAQFRIARYARRRCSDRDYQQNAWSQQHSDTQIYARVTPKKLFEDMDKFIEANKDFKFVL